MVDSLKRLLNTDNLFLARNTLSLALIKGSDMITQLLVLPCLVSKLGMEAYGQIAFFIVIMQYIMMFCDFGYNFNAAKRVSQNSETKNLSLIFTSVTFTKVVIMTILVFIIIMASFLFKETLPPTICLSLVFYTVFSAFTVDWLFLGLQKMIVPAIIKIGYRIFYVLYVYLAIDITSSYMEVVLLDAMCPVVITSLSLLYAFVFIQIRFVKLDYSYIIALFKESWILFSSSIFITFYRNINVVLLKLIAGEYYAGAYAAVEKIVRACQAVIEPITTALFPFIGKKLSCYQNLLEKKKVIDKLLVLYIPILLFVSFLIWVFTPLFVQYMKIETPNSVLNLHIMTLAFFSGCLNYLLGYVGLVNLGKNNDFRISVTIVGCVSLIITPLLIICLKDVGSAISLAISESLLLLIIWLKYQKIKLVETWS